MNYLVDVPDIPSDCNLCRFKIYGEFERAGNNELYCELFLKKIKSDPIKNILIPVQECPNNEVNGNDK